MANMSEAPTMCSTRLRLAEGTRKRRRCAIAAGASGTPTIMRAAAQISNIGVICYERLATAVDRGQTRET